MILLLCKEAKAGPVLVFSIFSCLKWMRVGGLRPSLAYSLVYIKFVQVR
jgi:hypothetical protein